MVTWTLAVTEEEIPDETKFVEDVSTALLADEKPYDEDCPQDVPDDEDIPTELLCKTEEANCPPDEFVEEEFPAELTGKTEEADRSPDELAEE